MSVTHQELFDITLNAIRDQGRPSCTDTGECLYRGPEGSRCAAGHHIPDSLYTPDMERKGLFRTEFDPVVNLIGRSAWIFMEELQAAHDKCVNRILLDRKCPTDPATFSTFIEYFEKEMKVVALVIH